MSTLTVAGGNLFRIAADQLGDATQWIRIAQLNGLPGPGADRTCRADYSQSRSDCRRRHCPTIVIETPALSALSDGSPLPNIIDGDVFDNAHFAAARFRLRLALDPADAEPLFQPGAILDLQCSLGGCGDQPHPG